MQVFIISIEDEESPRLNKFLAQPFFQNKTLPFKKIGIKGGELSAKVYFEQAVRGRNKPLTPAELGCTLSHVSALEFFLKTQDEYALVLEDDAIIPSDLSIETLEKELKKIKLPQNTLFSLGGIQMKESRKVRGTIKDRKFLKKVILEVHPHFYNRVNYAVAYIVDREMAQTLVQYHQHHRKADDWSYLFDFNDQSHILMTFLMDHPDIIAGETNTQLSSIEAERSKYQDLPQSQYGNSLGYNLAKLRYKTYPL